MYDTNEFHSSGGRPYASPERIIVWLKDVIDYRKTFLVPFTWIRPAWTVIYAGTQHRIFSGVTTKPAFPLFIVNRSRPRKRLWPKKPGKVAQLNQSAMMAWRSTLFRASESQVGNANSY